MRVTVVKNLSRLKPFLGAIGDRATGRPLNLTPVVSEIVVACKLFKECQVIS